MYFYFMCTLTSLKQIENQKLEFKAQSKVGSMDNVKHKPGGGDIKIFDDKEYIKQMTGVSPVPDSHGHSRQEVRPFAATNRAFSIDVVFAFSLLVSW